MENQEALRDTLSSSERFRLYNSLTCLVKSMENKHTAIDLRNGGCVSGLIKKVDGFMNVEMGKVVFYDAMGREHQFNDFYISARNIRYVHIPKEFPVKQLMETQINQMQSKDRKEPKRSTFKIRRAQRYNEEILQENFTHSQPGTSKSQN